MQVAAGHGVVQAAFPSGTHRIGSRPDPRGWERTRSDPIRVIEFILIAQIGQEAATRSEQ